MVNADNTSVLLKEFSSHYPVVSFKKGSLLVRAGDVPKDILFITSGKVQQVDIAPSGNEVVLNVFASPAFLSVFWLFDQTENRFSYKAVSDVSVHKVPHEAVQQFMLVNPEVSYVTLQRLVRGLDGFLMRMTYQMYGTAKKKIAIELLIETKRFHKNLIRNVPIDSNINELTSRTGLARETVSRQLSDLQKQGLVTKKGNKIYVVDVTELDAFVAST